MTTVQREAPSELGTLSKPPLSDCTDSTCAEVLSYNAMLDTLTADDLQTLSVLLLERSVRLRVQISYEEALSLVENAWLSPSAQASPHAEIIRVKAALRRCLEHGQWHPEQVRDVFIWIARERAPHEMVARACVDLAISEAMANRAKQ
jgi:hypothetical protein